MTPPLRLLALAPYPERAPSTRYRLVQLVRPLEEAGVELTVRPFLDEGAWRAVRRGGARAATALAGRLLAFGRVVAEAREYDAVLVQRGLSLLLDRWSLRRLQASGRPLLYDFDDAVYLPQPGGRGWLERLRRPRAATAAFCRAASVVLAGNEHLARFAREARSGEDGVRVVPSVVDTERFHPDPTARKAGPPTLGWVGSGSTLRYLEELGPALRALQARISCRLLVVAGERPPHLPGVDYDFRSWRPEGEVRCFQELDVGLYPLEDTPWSRGKCGFKALQYLACGVPCVASPVGVLKEIVTAEETGLHARSDEEWVEACLRLIEDAEARARMAAAGRARVEASYSVPVAVEGVVGALRDALEGGR